jgi:hypothetical protein
LLSAPIRPEAKTVFRKQWVEDGREHLGDGLLIHSINHRRNTKWSLASVSFLDFNSPNWLRLISVRTQLFFHLKSKQTGIQKHLQPTPQMMFSGMPSSSSARSFASGFLQTKPRDFALAIR